MARDKTAICQAALRLIGQTIEFDDVDTSDDEGAEACAFYWTDAILEVFRDFPWKCGRVIADLTLVEEDPNDDWDYSYRYPATAQNFMRILSGFRQDSETTKIPFQIIAAPTIDISSITKANPGVVTTSEDHLLTAGDLIYLSGGTMTELEDTLYTVGTVSTTTAFQLLDEDGANVNTTSYTTYSSGGTVQGGDVILTDEEDAQGEYVIPVDKPAMWDSKLAMAMTYKLASMLAPQFAKTSEMVQTMAQLYHNALKAAMVANRNEEQRDPPADSEFISGR